MSHKKDKEPLILVDASGYVFRAYHVLQRTMMSDEKGRPTHVIFGVLNMLRALRGKYPKSNIITVFDGKGKETRAQWYPLYKATRPSTPPDLSAQIPPLKEIIRAQGFSLLEGDGLEADDLIAHLCTQAPNLYAKTYIVTKDKDLAQLVNEDTLILADERQHELWGAAEIEKKYGVPPEKIIDYLTLIGDTVDNIPGVPLIGPKTAVKLLQEYGSLDNLEKNAGKVEGKIGENLRASLKQLPLSKKLNTLIAEADPPLNLAELTMQKPDKGKLQPLYQEYALRSFLKELEETPTQPKDLSYETVLTQEEWHGLLKQLKKADGFALDLETTGLEHLDAKIVGLSFSITPNEAYYVPCGHDYAKAPKQLSIDDILADLQSLFNDASKTIVCHNAKFDFHILQNHQCIIPSKYDDTMLMAYLLYEGKRDLTSLSQVLLKREKKEFEEIAGKGKQQLHFQDILISKASEYAAEDTDVCLQLWQRMNKELLGNKNSAALYAQEDLPLLPILLNMERQGALLDTNLLSAHSVELGQKINALEEKIHRIADAKFNINSPTQLEKILYDKLRLKSSRKTEGGKRSTAERVLSQLARKHELPGLILEYRNLSKLKNTYTDALPREVNARTGRVHTSFHQAAVATGRLSSSSPNLQNIPIRTEEGRRIRKAFIAPKGYVLASADYSQIELRVVAHLAKDPALLNAFAQDLDIHRATAAEVFGASLDEVDKEQRRRAKAINFGLIYGMSAFGLANQLEIEKKTAQEYIDMYFQRYPGVKVYMEETKRSAYKNGWVETLSGRRIYTPNIKSKAFGARQGAERAAINAPVQGTAADLMRLAMIAIDRKLDKNKAVMILQVHDELLFEIKEEAIEECRKVICETMTQVQPLNEKLNVFLKVDFNCGSNWDAAH